MTCPSPAEINKVMITVTLDQLGKGCSLQELMEKCIQSFDPSGKLWRDEKVVHMILVMHSWVVPSSEFAQKLLQLYKETTQSQRLQICHLLRFWIKHYPEVFQRDSKLEEMMSEVQEAMKEAGGQGHTKLIDTPPVLDQDITEKIQKSPSFIKKRKVSLLFDHLEPKELSDHLSYLEFKCFCKISHLDYRSYTLQNSLREIPQLERSVNLCNCISQWVQLMILNRPTPQQRAEVFTKFIQVTQRLRKLQNFNTLMAVIGGLCHSAISRLKETHSCLSHDVLKILSEMTELLSSSSNYSTYRRVYNECEGFKIPVLGVQLKDLVSLNEALPDYLDNGKINMNKLQSLYQHIVELLELQKKKPQFHANKDLVLLLTSSLDLFHTEDEIYKLSYSREPRSHKSTSTAPEKSPTEIAQWTPEVSVQLDPETLRSNIEQMVECVFKFYDSDKKGHVSLENFEKVVASLPFSCHDLEKDRAGPISRQEMTSYLMKASRICSKLGFSFLQSLVETRVKKSPLCTSCIWAVANQVYVCGGLDKDIMLSWTSDPLSPTSHKTDTNEPPEKLLCQKASQTDENLIEERSTYHSLVKSLDHTKTCHGESLQKSTYSLDHLSKLEKERDQLMLENAGLHCANSQLSAENARLLSHISALQEDLKALNLEPRTQPAVTRILEFMDSLHLQCDRNA
ncbi:RAS guanyl-releasing protein 4 isoform X2 [Bombina bombina]|nr:RAS guanyl-releasing protein 4 isoform X2 [Bombina bombina]